MYLSAERLAIADQAVQETFEQTSVAWQAIPHWNTGDPAQTRVRNESLTAPGLIPLTPVDREFTVTVADVLSPTPDAVVAKVIAATAELAKDVDGRVIPALYQGAANALPVDTGTPGTILATLIDARALAEDAGYRAPSCLFTDTAGLKVLSTLEDGVPVTEGVLGAANINSLHRVTKLADPVPRAKLGRMIVLGRRWRIAHGSAAQASSGEEPVDLAVSVPPSLEVVGEDASGDIALTIRFRFATRIKDGGAIVGLHDK